MPRRIPLLFGVTLVLLAGCSSGSSGGGGSAQPDVPTYTGPPAAAGVPNGFAPLSASFPSATSGWVLGPYDCPADFCTSVLHTSDGGAHWGRTAAPPADTTSEGGQSVTDLRFASDRDGFAFGGSLYATHDGAASWAALPVDGQVEDLAVGNGRVWALVTQGCDPDGCAGPAVLMTGSASGGDLRQVAGVSLPGAGLDHIVLHGSAVYLLGADDTSSRLLASTDGSSFTRRTLPCPTGAEPAAAALSDADLVLVCSIQTDSGATRTAWNSNDGGLGWLKLTDPPQAEGTAVAATSDGLYVTDTAQGISASRDGGRTWQYVLTVGDGGAQYVAFSSPTTGFAITAATDNVPAALLLTHNAGRTWTPTLTR